MRQAFVIAALPVLVAACGGGSEGGSASSTTPPSTSAPPATTGTNATGSTVASPAPDSAPVTVKGVVTDGPVAAAQVCLYIDGSQAKGANGAPICSSATDAQGNYGMSIPRDVAGGVLTLVASQGVNVKLVSTLGSPAQVLAAAGKDGTITPAGLPAVQITQFTTADFVLADTNKDGLVSKEEFTAYVTDYAKVRPVAALVKAAIDGGQASALLVGNTKDTLALAQAAAYGRPFGASNQLAAQWTADPANASALAAVDLDAAIGASLQFANYQLSTTVTSSQLASTTTVANNTIGTATLSCHVNTDNESAVVKIAIDKVRGVLVLAHDGGQAVGTYNAQTGAVSLIEASPRAVSMVTPAGVTYFAEDYFKIEGTVDPGTGKLTGIYSELQANTWSVDSTRKECTASGPITAVRL